uniref:Uncharacterized protein n=1 Tax=Leersia perrieri TaxID=77586 RepID=A0A0D9V2E1_9ORYZ
MTSGGGVDSDGFLCLNIKAVGVGPTKEECKPSDLTGSTDGITSTGRAWTTCSEIARSPRPVSPSSNFRVTGAAKYYADEWSDACCWQYGELR